MPIKKPLHPGLIAFDFFCINVQLRHKEKMPSYMYCIYHAASEIDVTLDFMRSFFDGQEDVNYAFAFKLIKIFPKTTMEFWLSLQQIYDDFEQLGPLDENELNINIRAQQAKLQENFLKKECKNLENQDRYKIDKDDLHQAVDWINIFIKQGSLHGNLSWEISKDNTIRLFGLMGLGLPKPDYYKGKDKNES